LSSTGTPPLDWTYQYALPSDCVRAIDVRSSAGGKPQKFQLAKTSTGQRVLHTNLEGAVLRYVTRVTDSTKYDALFIFACSWLLASLLAGPVTRNTKIQEGALKMHVKYLDDAKAVDANEEDAAKEEQTNRGHTPDWIDARA